MTTTNTNTPTNRKVVILTGEPIVERVAMMQLDPFGIEKMAKWVGEHRPECLPDDYQGWHDLFPHSRHEAPPPGQIFNDSFQGGKQIFNDSFQGGKTDHRPNTDNELLVELAGRKCYDSFGLKAGKKSNAEYIANTQGGAIPHASILYHAKVSFFFAGISRRVSHELIRNYVGADRDEEGSPSQESTRFTHHYGYFVCPPRRLDNRHKVARFADLMQSEYDAYVRYIDIEMESYKQEHGKAPTGLDRKRIYEDGSAQLPHASETSFIWTTNPMAIAKLVRERRDESADLEVQRFANVLRRVAVESDPNLYTQPWMKA